MKAKTTLAGQATMPSAWIVTNNQKDKSNPSDRGRKSVKNNKVYLDDGQEFEIELHNPLTECVLCDIKLNGQSISKTGLVLRPGQRFYLDCFIDDKKKFIFNTYEVEDTNEANDAIVKNGLLEVYFYKEDVVQIKDWSRRFDRVIVERYYPVYYPSYPYWITYPSVYYGTGTINQPLYGGTTTISTSGIAGNSYTTNLSGNVGTTTTSYNAGNSTLTSGSNINTNALYCSSDNVNVGGLLSDNFSLNTTPINASLETGRVEKGTASSQKFDEIDMQFQSCYIAHTVLQILPNSRKPIETSEIQKNFCEECGSKLKGSENFCPTCGNKLK